MHTKSVTQSDFDYYSTKNYKRFRFGLYEKQFYKKPITVYFGDGDRILLKVICNKLHPHMVTIRITVYLQQEHIICFRV